jgi:hypothetical protein
MAPSMSLLNFSSSLPKPWTIAARVAREKMQFGSPGIPTQPGNFSLSGSSASTAFTVGTSTA